MQQNVTRRKRFDTSSLDQEARAAANEIWNLVALIVAANEADDGPGVGDHLDRIATTEDAIVSIVRRLKHAS